MSAEWDRVVELARISMENPAVAAVLSLHANVEFGHCEECSRLDGNGMRDTTWPCPTVQAIEQVACPATGPLFDDTGRAG
jgi:hypothetical protein